MSSVIAPAAISTAALEALRGRSVALVGLMGAGKTTVGRRLAQVLSLPFMDTDQEIEAAARMTIPEIFATYGEPEFRALEARVISRIAEGGQAVISTGGGAYLNAATREVLDAKARVVWLKADLDVLMERVMRRQNRPLLKNSDPRAVMRELMEKRYPVYALADVTVQSRPVKREVIAQEIVEALAQGFDRQLRGSLHG